MKEGKVVDVAECWVVLYWARKEFRNGSRGGDMVYLLIIRLRALLVTPRPNHRTKAQSGQIHQQNFL